MARRADLAERRAARCCADPGRRLDPLTEFLDGDGCAYCARRACDPGLLRRPRFRAVLEREPTLGGAGSAALLAPAWADAAGWLGWPEREWHGVCRPHIEKLSLVRLADRRHRVSHGA